MKKFSSNRANKSMFPDAPIKEIRVLDPRVHKGFKPLVPGDKILLNPTMSISLQAGREENLRKMYTLYARHTLGAGESTRGVFYVKYQDAWKESGFEAKELTIIALARHDDRNEETGRLYAENLTIRIEETWGKRRLWADCPVKFVLGGPLLHPTIIPRNSGVRYILKNKGNEEVLVQMYLIGFLLRRRDV